MEIMLGDLLKQYGVKLLVLVNEFKNEDIPFLYAVRIFDYVISEFTMKESAEITKKRLSGVLGVKYYGIGDTYYDAFRDYAKKISGNNLISRDGFKEWIFLKDVDVKYESNDNISKKDLIVKSV